MTFPNPAQRTKEIILRAHSTGVARGISVRDTAYFMRENTHEGRSFAMNQLLLQDVYPTVLPEEESPFSRLATTEKTDDPDERTGTYCCVFVESGYEELVARTIRYCGYGQALPLQRIMPAFRREKWRDEKKALLPGYVFIRGEAVNYRLRRINHVIKLLKYADDTAVLRGTDKAFAEMVFQSGGVIPKLQAVQEDHFVRVTDHLLKEMNGKVLRVDKRNRRAKIEIDLIGMINRIWLGLDFDHSEGSDYGSFGFQSPCRTEEIYSTTE